MPSFNKDDYQEKVFRVPAGDYPFVIATATERQSTAGNDMIDLKVLFEIGGKDFTVYDGLVFTPKALWKVKAFCDAVGIEDKWEAQNITGEDCLGRTGVAHLELGKPKQDGKQYMEVAYYVNKKTAQAFSESPRKASKEDIADILMASPVGAKAKPAEFDPNKPDDIPF
jgi:hypothetical protein